MHRLNKHWLKYIRLQHSFFGKQKTISNLVLLRAPFPQLQQSPLNHQHSGAVARQKDRANAEAS
jgi:hypothetical protein